MITALSKWLPGQRRHWAYWCDRCNWETTYTDSMLGKSTAQLQAATHILERWISTEEEHIIIGPVLFVTTWKERKANNVRF